AQLVRVENIAVSGPNPTLNLSAQSDGFAITTTATGSNITGSSGADTITGTLSMVINEFVGADSLHGGSQGDTLFLTATSADLNAASDLQLVGIDAFIVASASTAIAINLANQSEALTITGGNQADTLTGGSG